MSLYQMYFSVSYLSRPPDEEQRNKHHNASEHHPEHHIIMEYRKITWRKTEIKQQNHEMKMIK